MFGLGGSFCTFDKITVAALIIHPTLSWRVCLLLWHGHHLTDIVETAKPECLYIVTFVLLTCWFK